MSQNSRYRGVHMENGELMRPYNGWQSEGRVYVVLVKANQQVSAEPQTKLVEDENVKPAAGTCARFQCLMPHLLSCSPTSLAAAPPP